MTTTPEAKCEHRYIGKDAGAACPDCTPPKPADVAKVRTWYPILNGSSFMGMGNNDDMDHAECRDGFVTRLDYDALAAKVEKLEQAGRVLVASNTRIFDEARASCESLQAELTAERERVKDLRDTLLCLDGNLFCGNQNVPELRSIISSALTTKADTGEQK